MTMPNIQEKGRGHRIRAEGLQRWSRVTGEEGDPTQEGKGLWCDGALSPPHRLVPQTRAGVSAGVARTRPAAYFGK